MGWWKADRLPENQQPAHPPPSTVQPPHPIPAQSSADSSACPVDPKTRAIWLQQAKSRTQSQAQIQTQLPPSHPPIPDPQTSSISSNKNSGPPSPSPSASSQECSSDRISQSATTSPSGYTTSRPLSHERATSSIPRAFPSSPQSSSLPANAESETGTSASGNWIYPSESQFFHAVMRKQTLSSSSPEDLASSISAIIPIHNAVNERAWHLIRQWEAPATTATATQTCNGPKLLSFQGLGAGAKSPKAKIMTTLMGYTEPFDRHDWLVERCDGTKVEYVIDFYQGKTPSPSEAPGQQRPGVGQNSLNFYLDVRPKLSSLEGWRMRAERLVGWR